MLKSPHPGSLQSPRLQLVPEHPPGLHLQNKGGDHSWRSGRQVTIRSQVATAEPPLFFHLAAPGAAGRLCRAGTESSTQSSAPDCHHCQSGNRCSQPDGPRLLVPASVVHLSVESVDNADQECIFLERPIPCGVSFCSR